MDTHGHAFESRTPTIGERGVIVRQFLVAEGNAAAAAAMVREALVGERAELTYLGEVAARTLEIEGVAHGELKRLHAHLEHVGGSTSGPLDL